MEDWWIVQVSCAADLTVAGSCAHGDSELDFIDKACERGTSGSWESDHGPSFSYCEGSLIAGSG